MSALTAARRAELDELAVPVEGGVPVSVSVVGRPGAWRTAWNHEGGRRREAFGPEYTEVLAACAASRHLNERLFGRARW